MIDTTALIVEIDNELSRLTKLRAALIEANGGASATRRISAEGAQIISLAAKLRHSKASGDKVAVAQLGERTHSGKGSEGSGGLI